MQGIAEIIATTIAGAYRPRPSYNVHQWAEANVFLDNRQAPGRAGYYSAKKTPWNKRMQELDGDPAVSEVIVMKSSRSGVTEAFFNILRHAPGHDPGHLLYLIQNEKKVRNVVTRRIIPTLKKCAADYFTGDPDDIAKSLVTLSNMEMHFSGAGSDASFTEIPYKRIGIDEAEDCMDIMDDPEGESLADLARSRTRDVPGSKIYIFGKAKRRGGPLWLEYIGGTQEKFLLPCPNCNDHIELHEGGLRYHHLKGDLVSSEVPGGYDIAELLEGTFYECPACAHAIEEKWKVPMLEEADYFPTPLTADRCPKNLHFEKPEREGRKIYAQPFSGRVSLRISDFYCLHEKLRWGHLAEMLIEAETQPHRRRHFVINHTGRGYDEREASVQENEITALIAGRKDPFDPEREKTRGTSYRRGQCPLADPVMISCTGDVQDYGWKYTLGAWDEHGGFWLIDWGTVFGADDFDDILSRPYPVVRQLPNQNSLSSDKNIDVKIAHHKFDHGCGLVDAGFRPSDVFGYVVKSRYRIFPSKGVRDVDSITLVGERKKPWIHRGQTYKIKAYHYNDREVKDRYYKNCIKKGEPNQIYFPQDIDDAFIAENTAEKFQLTRDKKTGARKQEWVMVGAANDFGDCMKKQTLVWHIAGQTRLAKWHREREGKASGKKVKEYRLKPTPEKK